MITINATGSTPITVTLYELSQNIVNPYFTWEVIRKGSLDTIIFYQDDISNNPFYYNTFTFSIATGSNIGLTMGAVPLTSGEWNYTVYEQASPYILTTQSALGIVETGLLIVGEDFIPTTPAYALTASLPTITIYRG